MDDIPGYRIAELAYEGTDTVVYRGTRLADDKPVCLKTFATEYPSVRDISRLKREYELTRNLDVEGVAKPLALEVFRNTLVLVTDDFAGAPIAPAKTNLEALLPTMQRVAEIVGELHRAGIVHKRIAPGSILVDPDGARVGLTDFGIASQISQENPDNPDALEGDLAYVSPEQTGRMNRAVDYRTDFYSLGVAFYELLTGRRPFAATDQMELVHCHIARHPVAPRELDDAVPQAVSAIAMKLLAKNAEDRYQSAYGLAADLATCREQWQARGTVEDFTPGQRDMYDHFQAPQKLYGREGEVAALVAAFERVGEGATEMMLVSGYSGIGKSTLINEIHKPLVQHRGYFVSGKFDQFTRNVPYSALIQAFQELVRQILTEDKGQIDLWKTELTAALGSVGQVVADVIPEIELIIGAQPPLAPLESLESQNRFNLTFQQFVAVFATRQHPLVIFLDDLQWVDAASLQLIQLLTTTPHSRYLFLIGAYRDNEVTAAHPLLLTLEELEQQGAVLNSLTLKPLTRNHVVQFVVDAFHCDAADAAPLADLIFAKTQGNPFFTIEFLKAAHREGLLYPDPEQGCWTWDLPRIGEMAATDNVVELMTAAIQQLPAATQEILKLAACVGNTFDLQTLAIIREQQPLAVSAPLWEALQGGLVQPIGDAYMYLDADADAALVRYRFAHDRVQQAAYSLFAEQERETVHLRTGQLLLEHADREDRLFDIADHLNAGQRLLIDTADRLELARLNLEAGEKAKSSNALEAALSYFRAGRDLLPEDGWTREPDLSFALNVEQAECEYLNQRFDQSEALFEDILTNARTTLEKAEVYNIKTMLYSNLSKHAEAVEVGLEGLRLLDINLDTAPGDLAILAEIARVKKNLIGKKVEDLFDLPEMTDPVRKAAINLLMLVGPPAYLTNQNLFALVVLKMVNLSLRYGHVDASSQAYGFYAMITGSELGDFKTGDEFGRLSLKLSDGSGNTLLRGKNNFVFGTFVNHWRFPAASNIGYLREGVKHSFDSGDFIFAGYGMDCILETMFMTGTPLAEVYEESRKFLEIADRIKMQHAIDSINIIDMVYSSLSGEGGNRLSDDAFDPDQQIVEEQLRIWYYFVKCQVAYLFGNYDVAMDMVAILEKNHDVMFAQLALSEMCFYQVLVLAAVYPELPPAAQRQQRKVIKANCKRFKKWAANCPENFRHKSLLLEAERSRIFGADRRAPALYDAAIDAAREQDAIHNEALANELAARFHLAAGSDRLAATYLAEARYGYLRWGANAKVAALDEQYPQLLQRGTVENASVELDLQTVMKAAQSISGEIIQSQLLKKLMRIVVENAGAEKGYLILEREDDLEVAAFVDVEREQDVDLQSVPLARCEDLAEGVVRYVARTGEEVVLHDAARAGRFTEDAYIAAHQPRSVLCTPIINQGRLVGVLYLENNLATNAFTPDHLEVLNLLSSQAAISIENATLYTNLETANGQLEDYNKNLEQMVVERTRELEEAQTRLIEEMEKELQTAHDLQMGLMPKESPKIKGLHVSGTCIPATHVGGDFFHYFHLQQDRFMVSLADVTGHAMEAAIPAVMFDGILESQIERGGSLEHIFDRLNRTLYRKLASRTFVCFAMFELDMATRVIRLANGGCPYPYHYCADDDEVVELELDAYPLGINESADYQVLELPFGLDDRLVLCSDGIIEAENSDGEQFGFEAMQTTVREACQRDFSPELTIDWIIQQVDAFRGDKERLDDMTCVVLQVVDDA